MSGIEVPDILYFYRTEIKQERDLVDLLKVIFPYTAQRAKEIIRYVFPFCTSLDPVIRITCCFIINVSAYITDIFFHFAAPPVLLSEIILLFISVF